MQETSDVRIPVLTEIVAGPSDDAASLPSDIETLVAELQTRLAADTFALTAEIMRNAFAEMEANLYEQVSAKLRQALPELIDAVLREHLEAAAPHKD